MNKQDAINATHRKTFIRTSDGMRVRVNGKCKTWKTRPNDFCLPVKHGLYTYGYIDQNNAAEWESEY